MGLLLHALHAHQPLPDHSAALAHYEHQAKLAQANMARFSGSPVVTETPAWAREAAEAATLANVDLYTDWLGGECFQKRAVLPVLPRDEAALLHVIDNADVPKLVAMLLYPDGKVRDLAAYALKEQYLEANRGHIAMLADKFAWGEA